ncbi:hypothetical protein GGD40_005590 [Paraburkholderia bryophila]|uniref:Uncharacterized protein n=1 Tax=Paraburkholderia bryophila TaxID=420952 RepID=A0A7Y9WRU3_9BURK|nr:hypothetical protein [Paraburkholderia bryophila]
MVGYRGEEGFNSSPHDALNVLQLGEKLFGINEVSRRVKAFNSTCAILVCGPACCTKVLRRLIDCAHGLRRELGRYVDAQLLGRVQEALQDLCRLRIDPCITWYPADQLVKIRLSSTQLLVLTTLRPTSGACSLANFAVTGLQSPG